MVTLVRCHCCGEWQLVSNWDKKKPLYCEGCSYERSGKGRGQCAYCKLYPGPILRKLTPGAKWRALRASIYPLLSSESVLGK